MDMDNIDDSMDAVTGTDVIYITEEQRVEWNYEATKELLKIYDEKCDMLDSGIITTQKKLWELVSKDMNKIGYYYTGAQCENKWKTLKRNYRNKLDKVNTGSSKRTCPFESEIIEILSKRSPEGAITRTFYSPKYARMKKKESSYEINLNEPPGFSGNYDTSTANKQGVKVISSVDTIDDELLQNADYIVQEDATSQIVEELGELRKAVVKQNRTNNEMMRQSNEMQSKIVQYLDGAAQRECQNLELEETRMEQQNEIIKQMKIQNSLLQKLLEKL